VAQKMPKSVKPLATKKAPELTTIGARDLVEAEAPPLIKPDTYLEPFALRALGHVRGDTELLKRAVDRFQEMGLDWHAARTRALVPTS
jgi:hypothetical protein